MSTVAAAVALLTVGMLLDVNSVAAGYLSFTSAVIIWGWLEYIYFSGLLLGPRLEACPPGVDRYTRFKLAVRAVLYHQIAMMVIALGLLILSWGSQNTVAVTTFWVLWLMRVSTEVNVFFGVSQLPEHWLPLKLQYLMSYRHKSYVSIVLPCSLVVTALASVVSIVFTLNTTSEAQFIGHVLISTLLVLGFLEHLALAIPFPVDRIWSWGLGQQ